MPCPSCGRAGLERVYSVKSVPVHSCILLPTRQEALDFPRGDVELGFCHACGFLTNIAFDEEVQDYSPLYEDQQSFSPTFTAFARGLAERLIDRHQLRHKQIVEIGCSKGDFLLLLCELGGNQGIGIDPSAIPGRVQSPAAKQVRFIPEYYSDRHAGYPADLLCCRHTLEHIHQTADFLRTVRRGLKVGSGAVVFFELPDALRVLRDAAFWDIYYEHCSYFTAGSLARLFRSCGFEVTDLSQEYEDQYLTIEAVPAGAPPSRIDPLEESVSDMAAVVAAFREQVNPAREAWRRRLDALCAEGRRIAIWGSGSKCVAFLTTLDAGHAVGRVVDINPHRHGRFLPGLGIEITSPDSLRTYQPEHVLVMNPVYRQEIASMLHAMQVPAEVVAL
jgi:SAM-dependent methyltransferase